MQDWDAFTGQDPLPPTLSLEGTEAVGYPVDWLSPQPDPVKFDEFGPMFGSEAPGAGGEDDSATDLGEIVVIGERPEEPWWDIDNLPGGDGGGTGGGGTGGGGGGGGDPLGLWENARAWLDSFLDRFGDSAAELAERDSNSTFDRSQAQPLYRDGVQVGYIYSDNSFWYDRNGNGQPETHLQWFNGELWQDTNFDGNWDRRVR